MRNKVYACIVTYDRPKLLERCIHSILEQVMPLQEKIKTKLDILIWDNTIKKEIQQHNKDIVRTAYDCCNKNTDIHLFTNHSNNHDASLGFNKLVRYACENGYDNDYIWIMDDDTIPEKKAMHELMKTLDEGNCSFTNSFVEFQDTGRPFYKNIPREKDTNEDLFDKKDTKNYETTFGTFTSLMTKVKYAMNAGLPQKEFHIWGDDTEFSERLIYSNDMKPGMLCTWSIVHHMTKNNDKTVWELYPINETRMENFYYGYRNRLVASKRRGGKESMYGTFQREKESIKDAIKAIKNDNTLSKEEKIEKINEIKEYPRKGMLKGLTWSPSIEYVDKIYKEIDFDSFKR